MKAGRINPRVLILFMIVGILPIGIGALILLNSARGSHQEETEVLLSVLADNAQNSLNDYLQHRIAQVATIAVVPEIQNVVLQSNPSPVTADQEQVESEWDQLDVNLSPLLKTILGNQASRFLRDYSILVPAFKEIAVTDIYGRLVAATGKTSDFFQADERWWQQAYRQGTGGHYLGDVTYDESAGVYALEIAEPVLDPDTGAAVGVIKAVLDAQEIFGLVNSIELGLGEAVLLRGDGTVVASRTASGSRTEYPYAKAVGEAVAASRIAADVGSGFDRLTIGLPKSQLRQNYPELDWYLVVEQPHSYEVGPFAEINVYFLYVVLFSAVLVLILAWVFSRILSRPVIETDPHLEQL